MQLVVYAYIVSGEGKARNSGMKPMRKRERKGARYSQHSCLEVTHDTKILISYSSLRSCRLAWPTRPTNDSGVFIGHTEAEVISGVRKRLFAIPHHFQPVRSSPFNLVLAAQQPPHPCTNLENSPTTKRLHRPPYSPLSAFPASVSEYCTGLSSPTLRPEALTRSSGDMSCSGLYLSSSSYDTKIK